MPGEFGILHHVVDFQRLDDHRLVVVNDLSGQFVLEIIARIGDPFMSLGNEHAGLGSLGAAFLLARQRLLFALEILLRLLEKAWVGDFTPGGVNGQVCQPHIEADNVCRVDVH